VLRSILALLLASSLAGCAEKTTDKVDPSAGLPDGVSLPEGPGRTIERAEADGRLTLLVEYPKATEAELAEVERGLLSAGWSKGPGGILARGTDRLVVKVVAGDGGGAAIHLSAWVAADDTPGPSRDAAVDKAPRKAIAAYLALAEKACDSGAEASCWFQGIVHAKGLLGQKPDAERAHSYFSRACGDDLGGPGCPEVLAAKTKLSKKEQAAIDRACAQGRLDACRLSKSDKALYHRCKAGDIKACLAIEPLPRDIAPGEPESPRLPSTATKLARQAAAACDKRAGFGCATLALGYLSGIYGLPRDTSRAYALGMRACNPGDFSLGCYPAAAARLADARSTKGITAALALAEHGCNNGHMAACVMLGEAFGRADDTDNRERALGYWLMACYLDPEQADACARFEPAVRRAMDSRSIAPPASTAPAP
jgi:hypothetical protein